VLQPLGHSTAVSDDEKGCNSLRHASEHSGLQPPVLLSGERVGGHNKKRLRAENKQKRVHRQLAQDKPSYWTLQEGNFKEPTAVAELDDYIVEMCPKRDWHFITRRRHNYYNTLRVAAPSTLVNRGQRK